MITSWSTSKDTARMKKCDSNLEDFMDIFKPENIQERDTKDGLNYIAGRLLDYSKPRGKGNIINRCAVVLDCDDADKASIEALCEAVKNLGVRSVVHSTYSSTPDKPRVRVVIPLKDVVVPGDYVALCNTLMDHLNMVEWDRSCAQAERIMYAPAKPKGGEYWAIQTEGPLMDARQWLNDTTTTTRKQRTSKGNVAKRDKKRHPQSDKGIQGAFNRVYTIEDAIEEFDLPYEPCREGRWTYYGAESPGGLRLVEGREDLCISEHANTDPACYVDGNGSVRALSAFELCAIHLCGEGDDTSVPPRERASMQIMARRAAEDEAVRALLNDEMGSDNNTPPADISWLVNCINDTYTQAKRAADALRDRLAYAEGLGWLIYNEKEGVWKISHENAAVNCVADVICTWYRGAVLTGDTDLIKKVSRLRHVSAPRAIITQILPLLSLKADDFDSDPDLLCVKNGVVDLRTSKLMPHDPKYLMTRQTAVAYREGATHEAWDKLLKCLGERERKWLHGWLGCATTGHQPRDREAGVPILVGNGANGKSLLTSAVIGVLGSYARMGSHALLMPENTTAFAHAAVGVKGARFIVVEELPDGVLSGNAVKMLVGTPTMIAEAKYQMPFEFHVTHSLAITTNNLPRLDEGTDGVNRRLAVLRFPYKFVRGAQEQRMERELDPSLDEAIETPEVQEAALAWLVDGARCYYEAGQHVPPATESMQADKNAWASGADALAVFFNEMLIEDPESMIPWTHLCAAFKDCQEQNEGRQWNKATLKNRVLSHRLFTGMKLARVRTTGMSCYRPSDLRPAPPVPTGSQVLGMRGLRFRTEADDLAEVEAAEASEVEAADLAEVEVAEAAEAAEASEVAEVEQQEELIPVQDIPAPTPCSVPEREEVKRRDLIEEIEGLVAFVHACPGGVEEVNYLVRETDCTGPHAPIGKLRAFKIRLEGSLARLSVLQQQQQE